MARDQLSAASEALRAAGEAATGEDGKQRLRKQADKLDGWVDDEHGPDHGQLAKVERIADDVAEGEGGEVADHVETAIEHLHAYRETIKGV